MTKQEECIAACVPSADMSVLRWVTELRDAKNKYQHDESTWDVWFSTRRMIWREAEFMGLTDKLLERINKLGYQVAPGGE